MLSLGREDSLEEGMATHSSILAWGIPWTEWATVHRLAKSQVTGVTQHVHMHVMSQVPLQLLAHLAIQIAVV